MAASQYANNEENGVQLGIFDTVLRIGTATAWCLRRLHLRIQLLHRTFEMYGM